MPEPKEKRYKWRREDYRENTKGLLMVNTGDGKGKTTAALGVLVRAAGRGLKCGLIQFMKSKTDRYGEHESLEKLGVEIHTMGDGFTWDTKDPAQDIKTSEQTCVSPSGKRTGTGADSTAFRVNAIVERSRERTTNARPTAELPPRNERTHLSGRSFTQQLRQRL